MNKSSIRKKMQDERLLHSDEKRRKKSTEMSKFIFSLPEFETAKNVLFYLSKKYEARTDEMILRSIEAGKAVFLPKTDVKGGALRIYEISSLEKIVRGPFDVLEPDTKGLFADPKKMDLAIIPGVAFDRNGNRIGHGIGYYDKFLKGLKKGAPIIGLAFEFQLAPEIPHEPHDVKVNILITEKRIIRIKGELA